jgi:hypothetical protein
LLAILSDFDLSYPTQVASARQTLDLLKETVAIEQASGFDPSGASGIDLLFDEPQNVRGEDESASAKSLQGWRSQTDDTSLSQELSSLDLEVPTYSEQGAFTSRRDSPDKTYISELDGLNEDEKEKTLIGIFPALKPFDIKWTLKKCKWDASLAIDELMTQSFLEESGSRHRGIEAFSESDVPSRPRKGKSKKKRGNRLEDTVESATTEAPVQSKWDAGKKDVEFIVEKTGMPFQQVTTMYHQHGASVHQTISAIIQAHQSMNMESDDPMVQINTFELKQDFPSIPTSDLEALIQLTHPSLSNARELAQALSYQPAIRKGGIQINFRHAPIGLSSKSERKTKAKSSSPVFPSRPLDAVTAANLASSYHHARDVAFIQASVAYRKGKSDHLMGGAAAYYSQLGRDADAKARHADSVRADALVAAQSSRTELDLHGVNVKDAVRIASEKVAAWWEEKREDRAAGRGIGGGFRIVTGVGRHSEGGRGKLGPAVGKMLMREGWKVEVLMGVLVVIGVVRREQDLEDICICTAFVQRHIAFGSI